MVDASVSGLGVTFALVTGTAAGVLVALSWQRFRESPYEVPLKLLGVVMVVETGFHIGVLSFESAPAVVESLEVVLYGVALVAATLAISGVPMSGWRLEGRVRGSVVAATGVGLLLYAVGGPLFEAFRPDLVHWTHGLAGLAAVVGLYGPVHDGLRADAADPETGGWPRVRADPKARIRRTEWASALDEAVVDVLADSGLVLTPAVVAYNVGYSRAEVNRHLRTLEAEGHVERVERGRYRVPVEEPRDR